MITLRPGLKLGTNLVRVIHDEEKTKKTLQTQMEAEQGKNSKSKSKADALSKRIEELDEHAEVIKQYLVMIFDGITVHRYRDVFETIRQETISELGVWIHDMSDIFLDDKFLKYLGWCLNDPSPLVRIDALEALARLYNNDAYFSFLELFTQRFKVF